MKTSIQSNMQRQRTSAFAGARVPLAPVRGVSRGRALVTCPRAGRDQLPDKGRPVALGTFDDEVKEQSRKYRRTVFGIDNWETHRSTNRYARHIQSMFTSRVVWGLSRPLLYVASVSTFVVVYETLRKNGTLPEDLPSIQLTSKDTFSLTSFALSLLLVFRTNSSYGRWDEARKMWGLVLNRSRDIVRQGLSYIDPEKEELRAMLVRWTPAFSKSLMCHLRKGEDLRDEVANILLPHEVDSLMMATHRPNFCLQVLAQVIKESNAGTAATIRMDDNLTAFEDCLGGCERILKTPIPLSYTRHTSRFLIIWLTLLPFSLYGSCGYTTIPLATLIAFLLLGIEEIGVSVEEPFSILALEAICDSALNNTRELQAQHGVKSGLDKDGKPTGQFSATRLVEMATGRPVDPPGGARAPATAAAAAPAAAAPAAAAEPEPEPAAASRPVSPSRLAAGTPAVWPRPAAHNNGRPGYANVSFRK